MEGIRLLFEEDKGKEGIIKEKKGYWMARKLHGSIIITYRCNARCTMCEVWKNPTRPEAEIGLETIQKLPSMFFCNITGGEPFVRRDVPEIVEILRRKAQRIVISTNGYFTDRIVSLCAKYPDIGIRISIEGLQATNDAVRGIPEGFERGMKTLDELRGIGIKDIGVGMTVQDRNAEDLVPLYQLARRFNYEFATATVHNSHYFHKWDNAIQDTEKVSREFARLITLLLRSGRPKDWGRAYFNYGLLHYIRGRRRILPCEMGQDAFFLDPWGDVLACNGMDEKASMGNLRNHTWEEIWESERAQEIRRAVSGCTKNCWMIGSAAPAIWHHPVKPALWVGRNKVRLLFGKTVDVSV